MKPTLAFVAMSAFIATAAWANETPPYHGSSNGNSSANSQSSAGQTTPPNQAGSTEMSAKTAVSDSAEKASGQAKTALAPHSVLVQTSLQSALDQTQGMKMQLEAMDKPNQNFMDHVKIHQKEVASDLSLAAEHQKHLQNHVSAFPKVLNSDAYKGLNSEMNELKQVDQSWAKNSARPAYWQNKDQAKKGLDELESKISSALEKSKTLNEDTLDLKSVS